MAHDGGAVLASVTHDPAMRLRLALLGGFRGQLDAPASLTIPTRKTQALLAFLSLPAGRAHSREKLASLLWGGMREPQARQSLRQSLFTLRKALGGAPALLIEEGTIALDPSLVDVDVADFERGIAAGTPDALERAVGLYRGELLEGLALEEPPFEEWLLAERDRLRELALEAMARLLRHQRATGATAAALQTGLRLLAFDPIQEPVHRAVMRLYAELGRRPSALRQYQFCVGILQRELGVEPEAATKELYRELLRQRAPGAAVGVDDSPATAEGSGLPRPEETLPRELPLVGRQAELGGLSEAMRRGWDDRGHVTALIGEAGVGKSRLLAELAEEAVARGGRVLVGRCYEAEQILSFASWVDAMRSGHVEGDPAILASLDPWCRVELARLFPRLTTLGRGQVTTPVDYRRLFEGMAQLVQRLAATRPLLLILEDLHWGDEMSLRLLSFVGRRLGAASVFIVGTAREEDLARAPLLRRTLADLSRDGHLTELRLAPLSRDETFTLARMLAPSEGQAALAGEAAEQVWRMSEGNPFTIIETMRALPPCSSPAASAPLAVPDRVGEVTRRHLDSLSARGGELATVAAVIGRQCEFALLSQAAGLDESQAAEALEELVRRRVLQSVGERFDFAHDRIREVAYARLLPERRRALHARIAGSMAVLYADRLDEQVERLAYHAARGDLGEKAVGYLHRAGAKALMKSAASDAVAYLTQALSLLEKQAPGTTRDQEELALRLALGPALQATRGYAAPEVEQSYARARGLADALGTPAQQFQTRWGNWLVASHRASANAALDLGRELLTLAERLGDPAFRLEGHHALWPVLVWLGQAGAAQTHLEQGMALYSKAGHHEHAFLYGGHDPGVCCWKVASWASWLRGHPDRAQAESLTSLRLARELDHPPSLIVALVWASVFRDLLREPEQAGTEARALIALSREREASQWLAAGEIMDASVEGQLGPPGPAIVRMRRGLTAYRATGAHLFVPYFLSLLARACLRAGRPHEGLQVIHEARDRIEATGERVWEPEVLRLEGELRLAVSADGVAGAIEGFRRATEVARGQGARSWELRAGLSLARLLAAEGRAEEARREIQRIHAGFTEGFGTADHQDARAFLEALPA